LLLDTQIFLWAAKEPRRISSVANERILSHVSVWEIVTKVSIGKLNDAWTPTEIERQCDLLAIDSKLPIDLDHIYYLRTLPLHHHDPFDRLLIAQAKVEGLRMVTSDSTITDNYLPDSIW
jgi:PIN domain nuclease of toxin-antitoxin system